MGQLEADTILNLKGSSAPVSFFHRRTLASDNLVEGADTPGRRTTPASSPFLRSSRWRPNLWNNRGQQNHWNRVDPLVKQIGPGAE